MRSQRAPATDFAKIRELLRNIDSTIQDQSSDAYDTTIAPFHAVDLVTNVNRHLDGAQLRLECDLAGLRGGESGPASYTNRSCLDECRAIQFGDNGLIVVCSTQAQVRKYTAIRNGDGRQLWFSRPFVAISADFEMSNAMLYGGEGGETPEAALGEDMILEADGDADAPVVKLVIPPGCSDYNCATVSDLCNLFEQGIVPPAYNTPVFRQAKVLPMCMWTELERSVWRGANDSSSFKDICQLYICVHKQKLPGEDLLKRKKKEMQDFVRHDKSAIDGVPPIAKETYFQLAVRCMEACPRADDI